MNLPSLQCPCHACPLPSPIYIQVGEESLHQHSGQHGLVNPFVRSDVVFYETPSGGAVFSTGSIAWAGALPIGDYDNDVANLTANVIRRFTDTTPFVMPDDPALRLARL